MKNIQKFAFFVMICAFLMVGVFISPKSNNSLEKTVMGNQNLLTTDLLEIPNFPKTQTSNPQPLLNFSVPNPSLALIDEENLYYYSESDNGTLSKLYGLSTIRHEYGWEDIYAQSKFHVHDGMITLKKSMLQWIYLMKLQMERFSNLINH